MVDGAQVAHISVYFYDPFLSSSRGGQGIIVALSGDGCRIRTSDRLYLYSYVQVRIVPDNRDLVVFIDLAVVRSAEGDQYILEFLTISPEQQTALTRLLDSIREQR